MSWKLHGCPRCSGDVAIDRDADGWYESCLLCGYRRDLVPAKLDQQPQNKHARVVGLGIDNNNNRRS